MNFDFKGNGCLVLHKNSKHSNSTLRCGSRRIYNRLNGILNLRVGTKLFGHGREHKFLRVYLIA